MGQLTTGALFIYFDRLIEVYPEKKDITVTMSKNMIKKYAYFGEEIYKYKGVSFVIVPY